MSGSMNVNVSVNMGNADPAFNALAAHIQRIGGLFNTASIAASQFSAVSEQAASSANKLASNMGGVGSAASGARVATAGFARELIVIGHEAMSGRLNRIPGSLLVLTEYMGSASLATMGLVGSFAMAAIGAAHLIEWLNRIAAAKGLAEAGGAYFNPGFDQGKIDGWVSQLRQLSGVSTETAGIVANTFAGMRGATTQQVDAMVMLVQNFAKATNEEMPSAANKMKEAFESPTTAGRQLLERFSDASASIKAFDAISGDTAPAQQRALILREIAAANERVTQTANNAKNNMPSFNAADMGEDGMMGGRGAQAALEAKQAAQEADAQETLQRAQVLKAALANISNESVQNDGGTWFQRQQAGAEELRLKITSTASTAKQANTESLAALTDYWQKASQEATKGSEDQRRAYDQYLQTKEQLEMASLRVSDTNTHNAMETQLAALSAQQAAAKDNASEVMALEDQKLQVYVQYGKTNTAAYESELKTQAELKDRYAAQEVSIELNKIRQMEAADRATYSNQEKQAQVEVAANQMTKQAEVQSLIDLLNTQQQKELSSLDDTIQTLTAGTAAYQKAMSDRSKIYEDFTTRVNALTIQLEQNQNKSAENQFKDFSEAFSSIGSSWENTAKQLVEGTTTWQKAEVSAAGSVVSAVFDAAAKMIANWAAMELAKTTTTETQNAVRTAVDGGGSGFAVLLGRVLGQWTGLETQKTAVAGAQNAVQTAQTAATTTAQTGIVTAGQGAQVAATVAGGQAKVAATTAAAAEGRAASAAINGPSVLADAAKAASGAYAAVAGIPYVGPILAPIAAGTAFAAVAAYESLASFDKGSYELPGDMIAQVHKGEMIIPASQASDIRKAMNSGFKIPGLNGPRAVPSFAGLANSARNGVSSNISNAASSSFTQNVAFHAAPGQSFGSGTNATLRMAKKSAMDMMWSIGRNGSLTPRAI